MTFRELYHSNHVIPHREVVPRQVLTPHSHLLIQLRLLLSVVLVVSVTGVICLEQKNVLCRIIVPAKSIESEGLHLNCINMERGTA